MSLSSKGDKLLVGDEDGIVSLLKLSKSFYVMVDKEEVDMKKNNLNKLFEREQTKEKVLTTQKKMAPPKENVNLEKQKAAEDAKIKEIEESYMHFVEELTGESQAVYIEEEEKKEEEPKLENKEGEKKEEEKKEGENKEGENKEGENKEGENKEGENKEGENKEGENKEGENKEGENKEGENKEGDEIEKAPDQEVGGFMDKEEEQHKVLENQ